MTKKEFYIVSIIVLMAIFLAIVYIGTSLNSSVERIDPQTVQQIQTPQGNGDMIPELRTQADFQLIGTKLIIGTGFTPGFNFQVLSTGSKFTTEIVSKNGNSYYVGYLDLVNDSTSTKAFAGKMLDKQNNWVDAIVQIYDTKCKQPDGTVIPLTAAIVVGEEKLGGCAGIVLQQ